MIHGAKASDTLRRQALQQTPAEHHAAKVTQRRKSTLHAPTGSSQPAGLLHPDHVWFAAAWNPEIYREPTIRR